MVRKYEADYRTSGRCLRCGDMSMQLKDGLCLRCRLQDEYRNRPIDPLNIWHG